MGIGADRDKVGNPTNRLGGTLGRVFGSETANGASGVAADELRRHNLSTVLEHIHLHGPASRSRLTAITGLNRSTVADLIGELARLGLATEGPGKAPEGPGRPSPVVHPYPDGAVVLAIEIAVDSIAVATVGLGGHVYRQERIARSRGQFGPAVTVRDVAAAAERLLDALPAGHRLVAVGVGVVAIVRRDDGFVHLAPNLGWRELPLGQMIRKELHLDVPVKVANDADLGALGEHRRGDRSQTPHLVFISGEVGIGCGIIVNGQPLLGSAGYAGEAGHMIVNHGGQLCRCGARGCWETVAGEEPLLRRIGAVGTASGLEAVDSVADLAGSGDEVTLRAISEMGRWLGVGISNLVNLFNPDVVVLGGLYYRLFDHLEVAVSDGLQTALQAPRSMVAIERSAVGANATLIGAAELAFGEVIDNPAGVVNL